MTQYVCRSLKTQCPATRTCSLYGVPMQLRGNRCCIVCSLFVPETTISRNIMIRCPVRPNLRLTFCLRPATGQQTTYTGVHQCRTAVCTVWQTLQDNSIGRAHVPTVPWQNAKTPLADWYSHNRKHRHRFRLPPAPIAALHTAPDMTRPRVSPAATPRHTCAHSRGDRAPAAVPARPSRPGYRRRRLQQLPPPLGHYCTRPWRASYGTPRPASPPAITQPSHPCQPALWAIAPPLPPAPPLLSFPTSCLATC